MRSTSWCPCSRSEKQQWDCYHQQQQSFHLLLHRSPSAAPAKLTLSPTSLSPPHNRLQTCLLPMPTSLTSLTSFSHRRGVLQIQLSLTMVAVQVTWHPTPLRQGWGWGVAGGLHPSRPALAGWSTTTEKQRCWMSAFWQTEGRLLRYSGELCVKIHTVQHAALHINRNGNDNVCSSCICRALHNLTDCM